MKNLLTFLFIIVTLVGYAQKPISNYTIKELEQEKAKAAQNEEYDKAAKYKKAITLKKQLKEAAQNEEYDKAAQIKKQLNGIFSANAEPQKSSNTSTTTALNNSYPHLEFVNQVYLWNKEENTVSKLEKDQPETKTKSIVAPGYHKSTSFLVINGIESNIKIQGEDLKFLVKVTPGMDPSDFFRFVKYDILDNNRAVPSFEISGSIGGASMGKSNKRDVDISFKNIGDGVFEVLLHRNIIPGEYGFYGMNKMFSFSLKSRATNAVLKDPNLDMNSSQFTKNDIYSNKDIHWYGVDLCMFTYNDSRFYDRIDKMEAIFYKNKIYWDFRSEFADFTPKHLGKIYRNSNIIDETGKYKFSNYHHNMYLSPNGRLIKEVRKINNKLIHNQLMNYPEKSSSIGLTFIVEHFDEPTNLFSGYLVWFDMETKKIILSERLVSNHKFIRPSSTPLLVRHYKKAIVSFFNGTTDNEPASTEKPKEGKNSWEEENNEDF